MKIVPNKFYFLMAFLFGTVFSIAQPPSPGPLPPPPGMPIDKHLFILLMGALLYGIYIIYNHQLKTKAPV